MQHSIAVVGESYGYVIEIFTISNTMHLYATCVHYIRTHPYRTSVRREIKNKERHRHDNATADAAIDALLMLSLLPMV
jgi:hypothetical protein